MEVAFGEEHALRADGDAEEVDECHHDGDVAQDGVFEDVFQAVHYVLPYVGAWALLGGVEACLD